MYCLGIVTVLEVYLFQGGGEFNDGGIRRPGHSVEETFVTMKAAS